MSTNELPTSIKVIGWGYTILGAFVVAMALLVSVGIVSLIGLFHTVVSPIGAIAGYFALLVAVVFGTLTVILGQGILRRNHSAWIITFILAVLTILRFLLGSQMHKQLDGSDLWSIFVIWKLYEHRKLFEV